MASFRGAERAVLAGSVPKKMGSAVDRVNEHLATMHGGKLIVPAELFLLANSPSTIYNILSKKQKEGELQRKARGVYVFANEAENVTVEEIAAKKAERHDKVIKVKDANEKSQIKTDKHEFWTNGRSTSFRVFVRGLPADTVFFTERSRPTRSTRNGSTPRSKPAQVLPKAKEALDTAMQENQWWRVESLSGHFEDLWEEDAPKNDLAGTTTLDLSSVKFSGADILHHLLRFCRDVLRDKKSVAADGLQRVEITCCSVRLVLDFTSEAAVSKPP